MACLANGLVDQPSVGTGTVLRPAALEAIAREAGFSGFTILPTEHEAFRFYRLDPVATGANTAPSRRRVVDGSAGAILRARVRPVGGSVGDPIPASSRPLQRSVSRPQARW